MPSTLDASGIRLRPVDQDDEPFLFQVYASTREEELALTGWTDEGKQAFLEMQFRAQSLHYERYYDGAEHSIILVDGEPAGRLYLARWAREIRIVDIALLPSFRGRGIGTCILGWLIDEADRASKAVSIHVETFNPAMRLYQRLGFRPVGEEGVYARMERAPGTQAGRSTS